MCASRASRRHRKRLPTNSRISAEGPAAARKTRGIMLHFSRWQTFLIWLAVVLGIAYAAPNVLPPSYYSWLPSWAPSRPMTLGLDLQGGSHILLQIDRDELVHERLGSARDDVRRVLRDKRIGYTG